MDKMMKRKRVTALMLCVLMSLSSLPASALEVPAEEPFSEIYVSSEGSDKSGDGFPGISVSVGSESLR